jgi:hypothetical protein
MEQRPLFEFVIVLRGVTGGRWEFTPAIVAWNGQVVAERGSLIMTPEELVAAIRLEAERVKTEVE